MKKKERKEKKKNEKQVGNSKYTLTASTGFKWASCSQVLQKWSIMSRPPLKVDVLAVCWCGGQLWAFSAIITSVRSNAFWDIFPPQAYFTLFRPGCLTLFHPRIHDHHGDSLHSQPAVLLDRCLKLFKKLCFCHIM